MTDLKAEARARSVQAMFGRIARRYDLMNRVMTAGQDVRWRQEVILRAALPPGGRLLDLGAGTGDLARTALHLNSTATAVAADFTLQMMQVGRGRPPVVHEGERLAWCAADALHIPFPDASFDAVVSGFLVRNVVDLMQTLAEQRRVLRPGGRVVVLDTTPPPDTILTPLIRFHLHTVIPAVGGLLTGRRDAYIYLPDSTESFLEPERLAQRLLAVGFRRVGFHRRMLGTVAIYWGQR